MERELVQRMKFINGVTPQDIDGVAVDGSTAALGDAVCMKDYGHLTVIIKAGLCPDTRAVTLKQSTSAALGSEKALAFTQMYADVGMTGALTKTTVTANTFNLAATTGNKYIIEINADDLDMANSFDWVRVNIATGDTSATIVDVEYILSEPKFAAGAAGMPGAIA